MEDKGIKTRRPENNPICKKENKNLCTNLPQQYLFGEIANSDDVITFGKIELIFVGAGLNFLSINFYAEDTENLQHPVFRKIFYD